MNKLTPIPADRVSEIFTWRDWFTRIPPFCNSLLDSVTSLTNTVNNLPSASKVKIAVIGDSISTRNNGASTVSWPDLLGTMIKDRGVSGYAISNFSLEGLTWKTAHTATAGWLIDSKSPVDAMKASGSYDYYLVCLGVNDRANPSAVADMLSFFGSLAGLTGTIIVVKQKMWGTGYTQANCVVTPTEAAFMDSVYSAMPAYGSFYSDFADIYNFGMTYDKLHPTNTGKQYIANSVYVYLQSILPLTPITRNIAWLISQTPDVQAQMFNVNTTLAPAYNKFEPTTGFSIAVDYAVNYVILDPLTDLAAGTIVLPTATDGFVLTIVSTKKIKALTLSASGGVSVKNFDGTLQLMNTTPGKITGYSTKLIYVSSNSTWYGL